MDDVKGESMKVSSNGSINLEFHVAKVISDSGLLLCQSNCN